MLVFARVVFWIGIAFFVGCLIFLCVAKLIKPKNKKNYK